MHIECQGPKNIRNQVCTVPGCLQYQESGISSSREKTITGMRFIEFQGPDNFKIQVYRVPGPRQYQDPDIKSFRAQRKSESVTGLPTDEKDDFINCTILRLNKIIRLEYLVYNNLFNV